MFHSSSGDPRITKLILGDIIVKQIKNSSIIKDIIICEVLEKTFKFGLCDFLTFGGINLLLIKKL